MSLLAANTFPGGCVPLRRYAAHGYYAEVIECHYPEELDKALSAADGSRLLILTRDQQLPEPAVVVEVMRDPTPMFAIAFLHRWAIVHYADDDLDNDAGLMLNVRADRPDDTYHAGPAGTPVPYSATYSAQLRGWSAWQLAVITLHAGVRDLPQHLVAGTEYGIEMSIPSLGRIVGAANFDTEAEARTYLHDRVLPWTRPQILTRISYPRRGRGLPRLPLTAWAPLPQ